MSREGIAQLLTIGYNIWNVKDVESKVEELDAVLVDVRLKAYSRKSNWTMKALQTRFGERYVWMGELGNQNYKGDRGKGVILANPGKGVAKVLALLEKQPVILMCGCGNLRICHRLDVAKLIVEETGCEVQHLWPPQKPKKQPAKPQLPLF